MLQNLISRKRNSRLVEKHRRTPPSTINNIDNNLQTDHYDFPAHKTILSWQMPMENFLCNSSRPCIRRNYFENSKSDSKKIFTLPYLPNTEPTQTLSTSKPNTMPSTPKELRNQAQMVLSNERSPPYSDSKDFKNGFFLKDHKKSYPRSTVWPLANKLCNASRPCKYLPVTENSRNGIQHLKQFRYLQPYSDIPFELPIDYNRGIKDNRITTGHSQQVANVTYFTLYSC